MTLKWYESYIMHAEKLVLKSILSTISFFLKMSLFFERVQIHKMLVDIQMLSQEMKGVG